MRVRIVLGTAIAGLLALVPSARATSPAAPARTASPPRSEGHLAGLEALKHDVATTDNWAGYTVLPPANHQITATHTSFVVPGTQTSTPGGAAAWTGIGGWFHADLIQAGVAFGDSLGGTYAWYEMLPDSPVVLENCAGDADCTVQPGQTVKVDLYNLAGDTWLIKMADMGHWTWQQSFQYHSSLSSAEWVLEAPSILGVVPTLVPFPDDTRFGPGNTFAVDHRPPVKLGSGHPITVNMAFLGVLSEAQPSSLAPDGDGFTGCAFKSTCTPPPN